MKKTLYYKVQFRLIGKFYETGFLAVRLKEDGSIKSIEGILTLDYICARIMDQYLVFEYYEKKWEMAEPEFKCQFALELQDIEIPFNFSFEAKNWTFEMTTTNTVIDVGYQQHIEELLKNYKETNNIVMNW